uniref:CxC2-like cysteine cluster KDZ transposase-associated domain-containing protein n=1 Tax=Moniliophthora roreri TaxID=221103 RepID=A0A0W0G9G7_MONRR
MPPSLSKKQQLVSMTVSQDQPTATKNGSNPECTNTIDDSSTQHERQEDNMKKNWNQGMSALMESFQENMDHIQAAYINQSYDERVHEMCPCSSGNLRLFRCTNCWIKGVQCSQCIVEQHSGLPFHTIEHWNGSYFEAATLADLSVWVYLGHQGSSCPHSKKEFKHITLLHTAGIFDILVNFCFCNGHPENFAQLLDLRMFPGSMERIGIAFTFELLDDFHLHTLTSKKTAFDYYNALQWKTNPMLPQKVQDCYHAFL